VDVVNLSALIDRGKGNFNLTIETTRTLDGRVKLVSHVGSSHYDDVVIGTESIHLHEDLIESTVTFVVRAHLLVTLLGDSIDFINEYNRRRVSLSLLK
jgi:type V secretory pathway adhesin AidA